MKEIIKFHSVVVMMLISAISATAQSDSYTRKGAKSGNPYYMVCYAMDLEGKMNAKDSLEAKKWYRKAETKYLKLLNKKDRDNYGDTSWSLGHIYYETKDYPKALHYLQISASKGSGNASWYLGRMFRDGIGCDIDYKKAIGWFGQATEQGHIYAELELAIMYYDDKYGLQDYSLARKHFVRLLDCAYDHIKTVAKAYLGMGFYKGYFYTSIKDAEGNWVKLDGFKHAFNYLKEASEKIIYCPASAMRVLSACYRYGKGTDIDNEKAEYWLNEAAKHNDDIALKILEF